MEPRKPGQMLNDMLVLVANRFNGIYDKGGRPYFFHCLTVMELLNSDDEELCCGALGHDLIEDTNTTYLELTVKFSPRVVKIIRGMTRQNGQTEEEYADQILADIDLVKVKKADIEHNSQITRLKGLREKDFVRMQKYHRMYMILKARLEEYEACKGTEESV